MGMKKPVLALCLLASGLVCRAQMSGSMPASTPASMPAAAPGHAQAATPGKHPGDHTHEPGPVSTALSVIIDGKVKVFTLADLKALKQTDVTVVDGKTKKDMTWTGPLLSDVLAACGLLDTPDTEHHLLHRYLLAYGTDSYAVVYSMAEILDTFHKGQTIVAIQRDGAPLPQTIAQFTLFDSADIKTARRISNLSAIEVRNATDTRP